MNKYAAHGIVAHATEGRRIMVVTYNCREAHFALQMLVDEACSVDGRVARILSANGGERIEMRDGSRIYVRALNNAGYRGLSVDDVYLDARLEDELDDDLLGSLIACTATSKDGGLVFA